MPGEHQFFQRVAAFAGRVAAARAAGADAVQVGTPFAVTEEGDAHPVFKKVLAEGGVRVAFIE